MQLNTREYTAEKAAQGSNAEDFITQITTEYGEVKDFYNEIFKAGEGDDKDRIKESKFAQLDKLILEVLKNNS
jgi:hypothetical protein